MQCINLLLEQLRGSGNANLLCATTIVNPKTNKNICLIILPVK